MDHTVDKIVDARGQTCPMPVVLARKASRDLASGQVLVVEATDPGSQADIPSWANALGHEMVEQTIDGDVFRYVIRVK